MLTSPTCMNKLFSLFLTINVGCLFSWGSTVRGFIHSSLLFYEADDAPMAMTIINKHLITISPFQQPRNQMRVAHVWKIVSTVTLWILWKYRCKRRYDSIIPLLSNILHWNYGGAYWQLCKVNMTICKAL